MKTTSYTDCLASMYTLRRFGIKLELDTIEQILSGLGDPQHRFRSIHIAGTNGKGSVAAILSTILIQAGYKVGRYTSPHLERFNERICIDNQPITDEDVVSLYDAVTAAPPESRQPTFFEFATAMALLQFGREQVDWAIIETGMGGRMDATNMIRPALTIITNISLEHKAYLGSTLSAIAFEKAGIIKPGIPVVNGVHQPTARNVILDRADELNAPAFQKGKDFRVRTLQDNRFSYYGLMHTLNRCTLGLQGSHQIANASLALAACELLEQDDAIKMDASQIRSGLEQTHWPGRLEVVSHHPYIILDGAHNLMAARALANYLGSHFDKTKVTMVVGILDDKPHHQILKMLADVSSRVIVTRPVLDRAIPAETLQSDASQWWPDVLLEPTVDRALRKAVELSADDQAICVAGSLYVVGEAKSALSNMKLE